MALFDRRDIVGSETVARRISEDLAVSQAAQTAAECSSPYSTVPAAINRIHAVLRQSVGLLVCLCLECVSINGYIGHAARSSSNPQIIRIAPYRINYVMVQPVDFDRFNLSILHPVQTTVCRSKPHTLRCIHVYRSSTGGGQALLVRIGQECSVA